MCYSVLLGYSPCLTLVADVAVDLLLCSMRCAAGGAAPRDWALCAQRAQQLIAWHTVLLEGCCQGALAPLNEWSHIARAGLVPAVLLHYGAVFTVRGPLPLACQPGTHALQAGSVPASARAHGAAALRGRTQRARAASARRPARHACIAGRLKASPHACKKNQHTGAFSWIRAPLSGASCTQSCALAGLPNLLPSVRATARC